MAEPRVLVAPDAFKGTAGAPAIAAAAAAAARAGGWEADACPLSDGGEGFADVLAAASSGSGAWRETEVTGPLGRPVRARWWMEGDEAVLESAAASGLPLAGGPEANDPVAAATTGTGELVVAAMAAGARRVLVGVGGSATTDGGWGALGPIEEFGGLGGVEVVVACDVQTRFVEAAAQFAPQKGATPAQVDELRARLVVLADRYRNRYGVDVEALGGAGAAGGLAGGLAALGARLVPGFDVVARSVGLAARMAGSDLVVTGEGRLDASSWVGKVVGGVLGMAAGAWVPVLVVAGAVGPGGAEGVPGAVDGGPPDVWVVSLADRFGLAAALADPAGCVARVVGGAVAGIDN